MAGPRALEPARGARGSENTWRVGDTDETPLACRGACGSADTLGWSRGGEPAGLARCVRQFLGRGDTGGRYPPGWKGAAPGQSCVPGGMVCDAVRRRGCRRVTRGLRSRRLALPPFGLPPPPGAGAPPAADDARRCVARGDSPRRGAPETGRAPRELQGFLWSRQASIRPPPPPPPAAATHLAVDAAVGLAGLQPACAGRCGRARPGNQELPASRVALAGETPAPASAPASAAAAASASTAAAAEAAAAAAAAPVLMPRDADAAA